MNTSSYLPTKADSLLARQITGLALAFCTMLAASCGFGVAAAAAGLSSNGGDPPSLNVVSTVPAGGTIDAMPGTSITISFDSVVDSTSVNAATLRVYRSDGTSIPGAYQTDGGAVVFIASSGLDLASHHVVELTTGIRGQNGSTLANAESFSFETADAEWGQVAIVAPGIILEALSLDDTLGATGLAIPGGSFVFGFRDEGSNVWSQTGQLFMGGLDAFALTPLDSGGALGAVDRMNEGLFLFEFDRVSQLWGQQLEIPIPMGFRERGDSPRLAHASGINGALIVPRRRFQGSGEALLAAGRTGPMAWTGLVEISTDGVDVQRSELIAGDSTVIALWSEHGSGQTRDGFFCNILGPTDDWSRDASLRLADELDQNDLILAATNGPGRSLIVVIDGIGLRSYLVEVGGIPIENTVPGLVGTDVALAANGDEFRLLVHNSNELSVWSYTSSLEWVRAPRGDLMINATGDVISLVDLAGRAELISVEEESGQDVINARRFVLGSGWSDVERIFSAGTGPAGIDALRARINAGGRIVATWTLRDSLGNTVIAASARFE